uniref:Protein kinase domain-containing protein n=1 Tax=Corethron hystrix TaxID=216773 RepID=A0A7S1B4Z8_9STRA|mmetsp:Transcript_12550/g.27733  ORF Transcript_12550/g.27733 Transcript_12550/m.27733 type:complete len:223 (+) Transcript_12550:117-785(+)
MSQDKKYEEKKTSLTAAAAELVQDMDFSIHGHDGSDHNEFGKHRCIPSFSAKEFELGRVLGRGSFSIVYEVTSIDLIESLTYFSDRENLVRTSMKEKCQRRNGDVDNSRYAVKVLNPDLPEEQRNLGREDLANEAFFLRDISHSNIIKMRAISTSSSKSLKFFIVLDRLYGTLEQKIYKWKSKSVGIKSIFTSKKGKNKHLAERLTVAFDIVCALQYLHENK